VAKQAVLDKVAFLLSGENRHDTAFDEVDTANGCPCFDEHGSQRQLGQLEVGRKQPVIVR